MNTKLKYAAIGFDCDSTVTNINVTRLHSLRYLLYAARLDYDCDLINNGRKVSFKAETLQR